MQSVERPLADRMRPVTLDEYQGQAHILGPGKPLRKAIEAGHLHSMILWGPPGTGKTTLARLLADLSTMQFLAISAVMGGVKDIRAAVQQAQDVRQNEERGTVLFIDEVHRFNKSQQDALLPYVEDGTVILIGATTENPSFELNNALLSRARVYVLKNLEEGVIAGLLKHALTSPEGLSARNLAASDKQLMQIAQAADGDARRALHRRAAAARRDPQRHLGAPCQAAARAGRLGTGRALSGDRFGAAEAPGGRSDTGLAPP